MKIDYFEESKKNSQVSNSLTDDDNDHKNHGSINLF